MSRIRQLVSYVPSAAVIDVVLAKHGQNAQIVKFAAKNPYLTVEIVDKYYSLFQDAKNMVMFVSRSRDPEIGSMLVKRRERRVTVLSEFLKTWVLPSELFENVLGLAPKNLLEDPKLNLDRYPAYMMDKHIHRAQLDVQLGWLVRGGHLLRTEQEIWETCVRLAVVSVGSPITNVSKVAALLMMYPDLKDRAVAANSPLLLYAAVAVKLSKTQLNTLAENVLSDPLNHSVFQVASVLQQRSDLSEEHYARIRELLPKINQTLDGLGPRPGWRPIEGQTLSQCGDVDHIVAYLKSFPRFSVILRSLLFEELLEMEEVWDDEEVRWLIQGYESNVVGSAQVDVWDPKTRLKLLQFVETLSNTAANRVGGSLGPTMFIPPETTPELVQNMFGVKRATNLPKPVKTGLCMFTWSDLNSPNTASNCVSWLVSQYGDGVSNTSKTWWEVFVQLAPTWERSLADLEDAVSKLVNSSEQY